MLLAKRINPLNLTYLPHIIMFGLGMAAVFAFNAFAKVRRSN